MNSKGLSKFETTASDDASFSPHLMQRDFLNAERLLFLLGTGSFGSTPSN